MQISQQVGRLTVENSKVGRQASRGKLRIVAKAGTNVLTGGSESLDLGVMRSLVDQIAHIHGQGNEVLLVTSGAVAAGREALGRLKQQRDVPFRQILASVGQSRLMHTYQEMFSLHNVVVSQRFSPVLISTTGRDISTLGILCFRCSTWVWCLSSTRMTW